MANSGSSHLAQLLRLIKKLVADAEVQDRSDKHMTRHSSLAFSSGSYYCPACATQSVGEVVTHAVELSEVNLFSASRLASQCCCFVSAFVGALA
eukprot:4788673-Amphidinium_carterae.1